MFDRDREGKTQTVSHLREEKSPWEVAEKTVGVPKK